MTDISVATYTLTEGDNGSQVSIVFSDGTPETITDQHPNFEAVVDALRSKFFGYGAVVFDLVNIAKSISRKFKSLSPRVTTDGSEVFFDGDPIDNSLTQQILKRLREDSENAAAFFKGSVVSVDEEDSDVSWEALVRFLELLYSNPNPQSRESFYNFVRNYGLTIDKNGYVIAYKGVQSDFGSVNKGYGIVDGVEVNGTLYNKPGSVLRFPRKDVNSNTSVGCAQGLHAGTHAYATDWARGGKLVAVAINPMNVVSVPDDSSFQKLRVCEYEVLKEVDPLETAVATSGVDSASYWASSWDDRYHSTDGDYDSMIDDLEEGDEIDFDYISNDGNAQSISEARIEQIEDDYLKAFVPSKDGYRTFKFAGMSNIEILEEQEDEEQEDEEAQELEDSIFDRVADLLEGAGSFSFGELFSELKPDDSFLEGLNSKISARLKDTIPADVKDKVKAIFEGNGVSEVARFLGSFLEESSSDNSSVKTEAPADLSNDDIVSFDYTSADGNSQRVVDAKVVEVQDSYFKAFVPSKGAFRTFKFDSVENLEAAEQETTCAGMVQVADLKVGDKIDFDNGNESFRNATVLIVINDTLTVKLAGGGYRTFDANEAVISKS